MDTVETKIGCTTHGSNRSFVNSTITRCPICGSGPGSLIDLGNGLMQCKHCSHEFRIK